MPEYQPHKKNTKSGGRRNSSMRNISERQPPKSTKSAKQSENKSSYNRTKRIRKNYILHFMLLSVVIVIVLAIVSVTVFFNVETIVVEGSYLYSNEEIINAGGIEQGVNLIRFNCAPAEVEIMEKLVCIESVSVKKVFGFPSSLLIVVKDAEKIFNIKVEGGYLEISGNGRIIGNPAKRPEGLIVTGLEIESQNIGDYINLKKDEEKPPETTATTENTETTATTENTNNTRLFDNEKIEFIFQLIELLREREFSGVPGGDAISQIDITHKFDIKMYYDKKRIEIILGAPSQFGEKLSVAAKLLDEEIDDAAVGVLRVSNPLKASFLPSD